MSKKNSKVSELYERALRDALSRNELREEHFGWTVQGKYLPRWAAESGLSPEFTIEQIKATLCLDAVQARVAKCKNMNEVTSIAGRVKGAESDLANMRAAWDDIRKATSKVPKGEGLTADVPAQSGKSVPASKPARSKGAGVPKGTGGSSDGVRS